MSARLEELYRAAAERAYADGCTCDDTPNGCISQWVQRNVSYREGTLFFIVLGIACEIANIKARAEGYIDNGDRAIKLALAKFPPKRKSSHGY